MVLLLKTMSPKGMMVANQANGRSNMVQVLMIIMAVCAVLGGIDHLLNNKFGLGKHFLEGVELLAPLCLSMAGMIVLAPTVADLLAGILTPLYNLVSMDPGTFGSVLAIDMGGYQLCGGLAQDPAVARFAGIIAAATFGCTISFTIPTGMGILKNETREDFATGIMYGLLALPFALIPAAILCGIPVLKAVWLCVPFLLISLLLALAITRFPEKTSKGFALLAKGLRIFSLIGIIIGAFQTISGYELIPSITPLPQAMGIVVSICITLMGSLPFAEILQRVLKKPLAFVGDKLGVGGRGMMSMLLFFLNATPGLTSLPEVNRRGTVVAAAFGVCAASCLTSHVAFTMGCEPDLVVLLIAIKFLGGVLGAVVALALTGRKKAVQK